LGSGQLTIAAVDLNPYRCGIRQDVELFDPDVGEGDAGVGEAGLGDAFGEGFDELNMTGGDDGADAVDDLFIVDDAREIIPADGGAGEVGGRVFRDG